MKKVLSLVLILSLVLTMASFPALAADPALVGAAEALGATIRLADGEISGGLRFGATIDKSVVGIDGDWSYDENADVEFGMYLLPAYKLAEGQTVEEYIAAGGTETLKVVAKKYYAQDEDSITYTAVLVGIPESGYAKEIVAVPYVEVSETEEFYEEVAKSYVSVAQDAIDSYNGGNPNGITLEQAEALEAIVGAVTPDEPGEDENLTEQQVALTANNIVVERYFPESEWTGKDADLNAEEARALFVDGSLDTYVCSGIWGNPSDVLEEQGFYYQVIVDLGAEKNLSKINFHVGAENYGNWWQYAAPLNPEILVAGNDGVYTSVYSYNKEEGDDAYRLDAVELDYTTSGAGIRYIKYTFNRIYANPTIAEIEVFEMVASAGGDEPGTDPEEPGDEPGGEIEIPTGDPVAVELTAESITAPTGGTGDLANLLDGDVATGYLVAYNYDWSGTPNALTSNNTFIIDLGAMYYNPTITLSWGGTGTHGWGWTAPGDYTIYWAGQDGVYTAVAEYNDLFTNIGNDTLPDGLTVDRTTYPDECTLTGVTSIAANGVRYIKVEMNTTKNNGIALNDVSVTGVPNTTSGGGEDPEEPGDEPGGELEIPTGDPVAVALSAGSVTAPTGGTGDLANLFDADEATGYLVAYPGYSWSGGADPISSNNVYVIDLGAMYYNPTLTLVWGGQGTHGWGWSTPGDYTIYYAGEDGVYTEAVSYTDIFAAVTGDSLPEGLTASRNTDVAEYILTGVSKILANGVRYIKIETKSFGFNGIALNEVSVTGVPVTTGGAGEDPAPSLLYYSVDSATGASSYNGANKDASSLFVLPEGYNAFEINGTYKVDADTLRMLTTVPCKGTGTIKYKDYVNFTSYIATVNSSWGQYDNQGYGGDNYGEQIVSAPVSKLSDPVYMSMVLPSEGTTYMNTTSNNPRNNGNNMHKPSTDTVFDRLNAIGAVYVNRDLKSELKSKYSGQQVTVCVGNIRLLVRTADGWIERNVTVPTTGFGMLYALPWTLENQLGATRYQRLCVSIDNSIQRYSTYTKVTMDIDDFLENKTGISWTGTSFDERVFHFWGNVHYLSELGISEDTDVLGVIASYEVWIEEEELAPYFIASIGADWRLESGNTRQACAGYKHAVTTEKQVVMAHSFGAADYETYVAPDLAYIKGRLGIE